jgi:hypothetical protein
MIPLLMLLRNPATEDFTKADWVLLVVLAVTGVTFVFFNGKYLRLEAEERQHGEPTAALIADTPVGGSSSGPEPTASTPIIASSRH